MSNSRIPSQEKVVSFLADCVAIPEKVFSSYQGLPFGSEFKALNKQTGEEKTFQIDWKSVFEEDKFLKDIHSDWETILCYWERVIVDTPELKSLSSQRYYMKQADFEENYSFVSLTDTKIKEASSLFNEKMVILPCPEARAFALVTSKRFSIVSIHELKMLPSHMHSWADTGFPGDVRHAGNRNARLVFYYFLTNNFFSEDCLNG